MSRFLANLMNAVLFCLFLVASSTGAAAPIVSAGVEQTLYSELLQEERRVLIALPDDYTTTAQRYPVLYVLDGEVQFRHAAAAAQFIAAQDLGPPMIVVGVPNTARNRDLTPSAQDTQAAAEHSFLGFLERELVPFIERTHRAAGLRILFTHSRGGLIGLQAMISSPGLFRAHLAASPYVSWNKREMVARVAGASARVVTPHYLFMTNGDHEEAIETALADLERALRKSAPKQLVHGHRRLAGESHDSTPYLTLYQGLRDFFQGWYPTAAVERGDAEAMLGHYAALSERFGYSVTPGAVAMDETGRALLREGKKEQALRMFEQYVQVYPADHFAYEGLSVALDASGRRADARTALDRALQLAWAGIDVEERQFLEDQRKTLSSPTP